MAKRPRNDLTIYDRAAEGWWRADDRTFASLRAVAEFRLTWLLENVPLPLAGARVVDLGCGGGLFAVPLAAQGARVLGLDRSQPSLGAARARGAPHARYACADLRWAPLPDAYADLVLLADVVEHVVEWRAAVAEAARVLRQGGVLYVSTINRTLRARWLAVHVAEGLGLVPRGTHDPALFVRPDELCAAAAGVGLRCVGVQGEAPRLCATLRQWVIRLRKSRSAAVTYAALFVKETTPR
jgi:2-polyprenyl-6-hydroxyphenyl methylase/3-demethylubiquinone-9 3-methyltransferase